MTGAAKPPGFGIEFDGPGGSALPNRTNSPDRCIWVSTHVLGSAASRLRAAPSLPTSGTGGSLDPDRPIEQTQPPERIRHLKSPASGGLEFDRDADAGATFEDVVSRKVDVVPGAQCVRRANEAMPG